MSSRQKAARVGMMVIGLTLLSTSTVLAQTYRTRASSGRHNAWFSYCEQALRLPVCVPLVYPGEATVAVTYRAGGEWRDISRIEQTMSLYNARTNNICNLGVGIVTDVYASRGASFIQTVPIYRYGSYIYASSTLFVGGYSDVRFSLRNPRIYGRGFAAPRGGATCFGSRAYNFYFDL